MTKVKTRPLTQAEWLANIDRHIVITTTPGHTYRISGVNETGITVAMHNGIKNFTSREAAEVVRFVAGDTTTPCTMLEGMANEYQD